MVIKMNVLTKSQIGRLNKRGEISCLKSVDSWASLLPCITTIIIPRTFMRSTVILKQFIAIDTGEVVEGRLPPRVLGLVQEWREYHKTELTDDWGLARDRKALRKIESLE